MITGHMIHRLREKHTGIITIFSTFFDLGTINASRHKLCVKAKFVFYNMNFPEPRAYKASHVFPILLVLYELCIYLSNDAYLPVLPHIAQDLNTSHHLIQLTLTAWFMGSASMQLFLGPVSDRIGRRPVLLCGGIIFILSTLGCALVQDIDTLLILRFIQGATISSMIIAGYATIHELFSTERAIHILALMNSFTILAAAFGPIFGAIILHFTHWRWIFGVLVVWSVLTVSSLFLKMPETCQEKHPLHLGKIFSQYHQIFKNKSFMLFLLTSRALFASMIAWITAGPFLLIDHFHFTSLGFGISQVFVFGSFILGTRLVKPLMKRLNLGAMIKLGLSLAFVGSIYALITASIWPDIIWNTLIALMIIVMGAGLVFPVFERLGIESSDEPMGSRVAISSFLMSLAGMFGSIVISATYNGTLFSLAIILITFSTVAIVLQFLNRQNPMLSK